MKIKRVHIIIILLCIILLIIAYLSNKKEGFEFKSDFSDFNKIDRIETSDSKYAYCIAGEVSCISGNLVPINDDYTGGKTYNYLSDNFTPVECKGNFQYNMTGSQLNWKTPTAREISFPFSDEYKGFTIPYSYIPTSITKNYINFWDASKNLLDNTNKCAMLKTDSEMDNCISATSKTSTNISKSKDKSNKKCVSNYGAKVGDPLCCGQTGVLQKSATEYVCGIDAPTCTGYKCGTSFGTCS